MKEITIPGPIKVTFPTREGEVETEIAFSKFVSESFDNFPAKTIKQVRQAVKVIGLAEKATQVLSIEDEDYAALKDATTNVAFIPRIARQLLAFYDAVEKAV